MISRLDRPQSITVFDYVFENARDSWLTGDQHNADNRHQRSTDILHPKIQPSKKD